MLLDIANHLWQSTLFAIVIAGLCRLLGKDGAPIRYRLWFAASLKFLLPFALLTTAGTWLAERTGVVEVPAAWTNTVTVVAKPFAPVGEESTLASLLLSVWTLGTLIVLARWALRALELRRLLRRAERDSVSMAAGARAVRVYRSDAPIEPGVVGVFRTALLLPAGLDTKLTKSQLETVVAHELCHVRRHDNLTAAVHMLVEAVFWFHPLVWWIGARLIDERERACDEMVVALGHDRRTYAESILDVCEHYAATRLPCAAGISGSDLKARVTEIMRHRAAGRLKPFKKLLLGIAALLAFAMPLIGGLTFQLEARAQEAAPSTSPPGANDSENREFDRERESESVRRALELQELNRRFPPRDPNNSEYMPIFKAQPTYPPEALSQGLEGYVVVQYTVAPDGTTENVRVLESTSELFNQSAVDSARKYKYRPRTVNGQAQAVDNVVTKIVYQLERAQDTETSPPPGGAARNRGNDTGEPQETIIVDGDN